MTTRKHPETETDADKEEVGRRIKRARERHHWTLDELSQATRQIDSQQAGVSKVSISGTKTPTPDADRRYQRVDSVCV